ncbi:MAG: sulfotransferase [Eubacteriales bacterium]
MARDYQYLSVAGHGWSGSEALMDLLREFDSIGEFRMEFRMFRDPHGIMDLEYQMVDRWDAINVDIAIKEFLEYIQKIGRKRTKFTWGYNHEEVFNGKFYECATKFIEEITSYEYNSYWWFVDYRKPYWGWMRQRIMQRFFKKGYGEKSYFGRITREEFHLASQHYMESIIEAYKGERHYDYFLVKQLVSATNPYKILDYCPGAKIMLIDRDPRDNYVQMITKRKLIGYDIADSHNVMKYVEWYKAQRINPVEDSSDFLYIQYEDLIYHYDEMLAKIVDFMKVDGITLNHARKKQLFNPDVSIQYVGIYKDYPYQDEIHIIEKELAAYLYDNKRK